jgi:hypothetical protein
MPSFGSLVPCTDGGWMVLPPRHCPNGHRLAPNRMLVGHQPCAGTCRGGHMTWRCRRCDAAIYALGVGAGCRLLDASAFKR